MSLIRLGFLTSLAMLAFAGNTIFCRIALRQTEIDAASFTSIRLVSGALALWLIVVIQRNYFEREKNLARGNWISAFALFIYAAAFSFAYITLSTGTGALLLFGAVQLTMICYGIWSGERLLLTQIAGLCLAFSGLVGLLLPGLSAPPLQGAMLMLLAGAAWGVYSLRGKSSTDPTVVTAGNFLRAAPIALVLSVFFLKDMSMDSLGVIYAMASGILSSGIGYAIWYAALPYLNATKAATIQLSVPPISAVGGIIFLGEGLTLRLILASLAILGGIALVILSKK